MNSIVSPDTALYKLQNYGIVHFAREPLCHPSWINTPYEIISCTVPGRFSWVCQSIDLITHPCGLFAMNYHCTAYCIIATQQHQSFRCPTHGYLLRFLRQAMELQNWINLNWGSDWGFGFVSVTVVADCMWLWRFIREWMKWIGIIYLASATCHNTGRDVSMNCWNHPSCAALSH